MGSTLISLYRERRTMKNIAQLSLLTLASTGTSTISLIPVQTVSPTLELSTEPPTTEIPSGRPSGKPSGKPSNCQLENTYLKGKPVENGESEIKNIPSWYDCQNLCDSNPQCESFTWNYWPSVCYLMSNVPGENYIGTSEGASSGIKSCWDPSNYCQLENTYLKGKPVENGESEIKNIPSWYDCQNLCDSNPQCESFTWNLWKPSVCYLMSNVPGE